jgi:hypothetical protein
MSRSRINVSLSPEALRLLAQLQRQTGLNRSAVLELLVHEEAKRRGASGATRRSHASRGRARRPGSRVSRRSTRPDEG